MKMPIMTATSATKTTIPTRNRRPTCCSPTMGGCSFGATSHPLILPHCRICPGATREAHRPEVVLEHGMPDPGGFLERAQELEAALMKKRDAVGYRAGGHDVVGDHDGG